METKEKTIGDLFSAAELKNLDKLVERDIETDMAFEGLMSEIEDDLVQIKKKEKRLRKAQALLESKESRRQIGFYFGIQF